MVKTCSLGFFDGQLVGVINSVAGTTGTACFPLAGLLITIGIGLSRFLLSGISLLLSLSCLGCCSLCFQFSLALQRPHLSVLLLLAFEHPAMADGRIPAGIGFHLGANRFAAACGDERPMAQAHQPCLLAQQHLNKKTSKGDQVAAAKVTDAAVVGLVITGKHP
jgi:hypothetical protein